MTKTLDLHVGADGQMVLPASLREAMGLSGEADVVATVDGQAVRLTASHGGSHRAQELYRAHARDRSTVEDFLAGRRNEADRETGVPARASGKPPR